MYIKNIIIFLQPSFLVRVSQQQLQRPTMVGYVSPLLRLLLGSTHPLYVLFVALALALGKKLLP